MVPSWPLEWTGEKASVPTLEHEFLFCCNLGSGLPFLTPRVRFMDPNESFYNCSNHRLRDSHVGRAGHWVDIKVRGECSDDDLALIERLAREADTRCVVVRRIAVFTRRSSKGERPLAMSPIGRTGVTAAARRSMSQHR